MKAVVICAKGLGSDLPKLAQASLPLTQTAFPYRYDPTSFVARDRLHFEVLAKIIKILQPLSHG